MATKYQAFVSPEFIKVEEETPTFIRMVAEPFERGYGHTIGNSLRRILLTSIEAPAIVSIMITGVQHEFMAVDGIVEDMTHIILNLKGVLLSRLGKEQESSKVFYSYHRELCVTQDMLDRAEGSYKVRAKDIFELGEFELINPEHVVFTATMPMEKKISFKVMIGRGYIQAEQLEVGERLENEIFLDASFSPVHHVNYFVEDARVGGLTDYDRLILEVRTDGRISPKEAISFASQIASHHFQFFVKLSTQQITYETTMQEDQADKDTLLAKLALKIDEIELSVRSTNCLHQANIETICELVLQSENEMLKFRNFGKKSLLEIKEKLSQMNLSLGMNFDHLGITKDNVKNIAQELAAKSKK